MCSRYHLCFAALSQGRPHAVPSHGRAVTGAPGARLLGRWAVGVPAPRCIRRRPLSPFHRPGALYAASWRVLLLFLAVYGQDYTGFGPKCQGFQGGKAPRPPTGKRSGTDPVSRRGRPSYLQKFSSESGKTSAPSPRGAPPLFLEKSRGAGLSAPGPYSPFSSATSASVKYRHCPGGRSPSSRVCSRTRRSRLTFRSHRAHMRRICRFFPS